jgi:hypothetical protein
MSLRLLNVPRGGDVTAESGAVRERIRTAVSQLAPDELDRFDDVWQVYLEDPRPSGRILKSGSAPLGAGLDIAGSTLTPLLLAVTGETLAGLVREPASGAARRLIGRLRPGRRKSEVRTALTGPAPDPAAIEHLVLRALFLDLLEKAGVADDSAAKAADSLTAVFTSREPGSGR